MMVGDVHPDIVQRVDWEPENDKPGLMRAVNEIVTGPVDYFHLERLADGMFWLCLSRGEDRQVVVISSSTGRAKIVARTENDT